MKSQEKGEKRGRSIGAPSVPSHRPLVPLTKDEAAARNTLPTHIAAATGEGVWRRPEWKQACVCVCSGLLSHERRPFTAEEEEGREETCLAFYTQGGRGGGRAAEEAKAALVFFPPPHSS